MAQHDYNLANQSGLAFRSDLNDLAAAIVSQNSGATAPATTFAFMWWADTSTGKLKIRNAANSAWIDVGTLASANLGLAIAGAITASGLTQSTAKLLGRTTAGTGAPEEIGVSEGVQLVSGALKADVNGLTEDTTPDTANDFAMVWDASASAHKKVKLDKMGGGTVAESEVRLNTANGYGSTNNKIRRFSTAVVNTGSDITYADSATNGASFTINTTGRYAISYSAQYTTGGGYAGISLNASGADLTTNIINIAASKIVAIAYIANGAAPVSSSAVLTLTAGDVIRPHTDGNAAGTATACDQFIIERVG